MLIDQLTCLLGDVTYTIDGFIEKNRDPLFQDLKRLMYNVQNPVIKEMWPDGAKSITAVNKRPVSAGKAFKVLRMDLILRSFFLGRGYQQWLSF